MTYIMIDEQGYQTDTPAQIALAQAALREAGQESAAVLTSPHATLEEAEEQGDPDSYLNGQVLFA